MASSKTLSNVQTALQGSNINATLTSVTNAINTMATGTTLSNVQTALATDVTASTTTITNAITAATSPLATAANLSTLQTTANTINTHVNTVITDITDLGTPSDISGLYALLTVIMSQQTTDPILKVTFAATNGALTTTVTSSDTGTAATDLTIYNNNLATALAAVTIATTFATQTHAYTVTAQTAVATATASFATLAAQWATDSSGPNSAYSAAQINAALTQLTSALTYLLAQQ